MRVATVEVGLVDRTAVGLAQYRLAELTATPAGAFWPPTMALGVAVDSGHIYWTNPATARSRRPR